MVFIFIPGSHRSLGNAFHVSEHRLSTRSPKSDDARSQATVSMHVRASGANCHPRSPPEDDHLWGERLIEKQIHSQLESSLVYLQNMSTGVETWT
jgi:hypothetical protein